jgi:hypothetical protein
MSAREPIYSDDGKRRTIIGYRRAQPRTRDRVSSADDRKGLSDTIEADLQLVELTSEDYIWDGSSLVLYDDALSALTDPQARLDYYREHYPNEINDERAARFQSWLNQLPPDSAFDGTSGYAVLQQRESHAE